MIGYIVIVGARCDKNIRVRSNFAILREVKLDEWQSRKKARNSVGSHHTQTQPQGLSDHSTPTLFHNHSLGHAPNTNKGA